MSQPILCQKNGLINSARRKYFLLALAALFCLFLSAAPPLLASEIRHTVVSGKVAWNQMGVEEANITATRGGREEATFKSAYHGSWRVSLPPGVYTFTARYRVREGLNLKGDLENVEVGGDRIDQLMLILAEEK